MEGNEEGLEDFIDDDESNWEGCEEEDMRMSALSVDFNKSSMNSNNNSFRGGNSANNSPQYSNSFKNRNKSNKGGKRNIQQRGNKRTSAQAGDDGDDGDDNDDITIQSLSYVKDAEIWFHRDDVVEETEPVKKTINLDSFNIIKVIGKGSFGKVINYIILSYFLKLTFI
jgi:hypothetical protein